MRTLVAKTKKASRYRILIFFVFVFVYVNIFISIFILIFILTQKR